MKDHILFNNCPQVSAVDKIVGMLMTESGRV
jgi:hypothetical protein